MFEKGISTAYTVYIEIYLIWFQLGDLRYSAICN